MVDLKKLLESDKKDSYNPNLQVSGNGNLACSVVIDKNIASNSDNFLANLDANYDKRDGDDEEISIVYQMDAEGYLMDEDGNYILDDQGDKVMLSEDQLDQLRANNILEEDI